MNRRVQLFVGAVLVVCLGSPVAFAEGQKHGKAKGNKHRNTTAFADTGRYRDGRSRDVFVIDRDGHRRIISEYYGREGLPPGLARRESLPPGLARQLRERGTLPPGLQRRLVPVPRPLVGRLPSAPPYYSRYFVGRDLVVLDRRTGRVAAIIPDVLPR
jgi:hypothetical protein